MTEFGSNLNPDELSAIPLDWGSPAPELLGHLERRSKNGPPVILDFFDHAQTRKALTAIDPLWTYEFVAVADDGLPRVRQVGDVIYLGIRLTVWGKTFPGIGSATTSSPDVLKELIGDALRNAAMSFGIAVNLWSKAEAAESLPPHGPEAPSQGSPPMSVPEPPSHVTEAHRERLRGRIENLSPGAKGTLRGSMQTRHLSLNSADAQGLSDIETLIIATELGEAERQKLEAARKEMATNE